MVRLADTNLPWLVLGRKVRPYAFAVTFICMVLTIALLVTGDDAGRILDNDDPASKYNLIGYSVGITAFFAGVFLLSGWWFRSDRLMRWGLLTSAAMFAARSAFLFMDLGWRHVPAWISLGLVLASGGAWLLERTAVHARGE